MSRPRTAVDLLYERHPGRAFDVAYDRDGGVIVTADGFKGTGYPNGILFEVTVEDGVEVRRLYAPDGKLAETRRGGVRVVTGDGWRGVELADGADPDEARRATELPGD